MSHDHVVIQDPTGERATVSELAAPAHIASGFTLIGPAVNPGDPRTPEEAAAEQAAAEAAVEAVREQIKPTRKSGTTAAQNKKENKS